MISLHSNEIVAFFLVTAVILVAARLFGELALKFGQPIIIGEIVAGIVLGPAVLGYFLPNLSLWLIPSNGDASIVLEGLTTLAVSLLLLVAGFEVQFSAIRQERKGIALTSMMGFVFPFAVGVAGAYLLPLNHTPSQSTLLFALFLGTSLTISSLPVIARILLDLGLLRGKIGAIIMSSALIDDLLGWMMLAVLLSVSTTATASLVGVGQVMALTLGFAVFVLTVGRVLIDRALGWIIPRMMGPGAVIGFVLVSAMAGSAASEAIGIHAVFGAFLVGIAIGDSKHLDEANRESIRLFVLNFFAPLYFATIGLKLNFLQHFNLQLIVIIVALAAFGKIVGCSLAAYWSGMTKHESLAVGFGMNTCGMMTIIFGTLAFQRGLIGEDFLVAFVVLAIVTSLVSGPMMSYFLRRKQDHVEPAFELEPASPWPRTAMQENTQEILAGRLYSGKEVVR